VPRAPLGAFAAEHLVKQARAGKVTRDWLAVAEVFLRRAIEYFGVDRELDTISVIDVHRWALHLASTPTPCGRMLTAGSVRHHLNCLSNLYQRAQSESVVATGYNPVAAMLEKPAGARKEARWFEPPDVALLLESARTLPTNKQPDALPASFTHPLLAMFALTGARSADILGLEVADVSFDRRTVTFRPNAWRRLKTLRSARVVPLWPQLAEILGPYLLTRPPSRPLFRSFLTGTEAMLTDWRKTLDRNRCARRLASRDVRTKAFRHPIVPRGSGHWMPVTR